MCSSGRREALVLVLGGCVDGLETVVTGNRGHLLQ